MTPEEKKAYNKAHYQKYGKGWYQQNKEKARAYQQSYWAKLKLDPVRLAAKYKINTTWKAKHRKKYAEKSRNYRKGLRDKIVDAYGSKCTCCGEVITLFLSIDHIKNDGQEERRQMTNSKFLSSIIRNNFPKDRYQLLCHNCNFGKRVKYCPTKHRKQLKACHSGRTTKGD